MSKQIVLKRKRGNVVRLFVEIDASQAKIFDDFITRLGISKADAIAAALNIWFNAIEPPKDENWMKTDGVD